MISTTRYKQGGYVEVETLPKGPNGRALCRWCSGETKPPRRTFCSEACVHEHKVRTNPTYVKKLIFKRDRGICIICRLDTMLLRRTLLRWKWQQPTWFEQVLALYGRRINRRLWEIDHIVPVAEGGGECGLENLRTVCIPCHRILTNQLMKRLRMKKQ